MISIGIDPGLKGGIAVIDEQGELTQCLPYTAEALKALITEHQQRAILERKGNFNALHATIEKTWAFPGMGVSGAHKYGIGAGVTHGILIALGIPYSLVAPVRWQKIMVHGAEGSTPKARAWARCQQLFPNHYQWFLNKNGKVLDGLVDAALIATFGRRSNGA